MDVFSILILFAGFVFVVVIANVITELIPPTKELLSAYTEYYIVKRNQKDEHN